MDELFVCIRKEGVGLRPPQAVCPSAEGILVPIASVATEERRCSETSLMKRKRNAALERLRCEFLYVIHVIPSEQRREASVSNQKTLLHSPSLPQRSKEVTEVEMRKSSAGALGSST